MKAMIPKACLLLLAVASSSTLAFSGGAPGPAQNAEARPSRTAQVLPVTLRPALYRALAKDAGPAYRVQRDGCAKLPKQALKACFDARGAHFSGPGTAPLALRLVAFGRGPGLTPLAPVSPDISANSVSYLHGAITEWWRALPLGFEQGFTLERRPAGNGRLTLVLAANGQAEQRAGGLVWGKLHYGKLVVSDANGRIVPAKLESRGDRVLITVRDLAAAYPLTIDPLVWLTQEVSANDGAGNFGHAVAVSGDLAVIGARAATVNGNVEQGAAYVFTKTDGTWTQAAKLTTDDGAAGDNFGDAVALDGTTAVIGAYKAGVKGNVHQGAAYVFTRADGTWTQAAKLTAGDGMAKDFFGSAVAVSGALALVGSGAYKAFSDNPRSSAYVFREKSDGGWTQEAKLDSSDGKWNDHFGFALALDGNTALVGAYGVFIGMGAAYVFNGTSGAWSQTAKLTANDGAFFNDFAHSVALAGTTAVIGAYNADVDGVPAQGSAYVFNRVGDTWTQTAKLVASDGGPFDAFGEAVAVSDDGTALVSATYADAEAGNLHGAVYAFALSNGAWEQTQKFTASDGADNDNFGQSLGLDGNMALIGSDIESAYFYGEADLDLAVSAPETVGQGQHYVSQAIATNSASTASPAVALTVAVPAAASFVSANATQGSCSENAGMVSCEFGAIDGNAGVATANVTLKATGGEGGTIVNTASIAATPALTASAVTEIVNNPPVASDGSLTTQANQAASGILKATDPDGDPLTFSIVTQPRHGEAAIDDASSGSYTYTPDENYRGDDSFTFRANDGEADSNVATISITVNDNAPVAEDGTLTTGKNTAASGVMKASDPEGDPLFFSIVAAPLHGEVAIDDVATGAYTYTPDRDYIGDDSFSFKASDQEADSNVAAVAITVNNGVPVAQDGTLTTDENVAANGALQASDPDGDPLSFSIVTQPKHGSVWLNNPATGTYTYAPADDYSGSDSFTFKANDGFADSNTATVNITVNAVAPPPDNDSGGGGGFGRFALLALLGLTLGGILARRRRG